MLYSLRFRLMLMIVLVLTLAVGVVALFVRETTTHQFYQYVEYDDTTRLERFVDVLANYYSTQRSWEDVGQLISQMSDITGTRVALVDNNGHVIASSSDDLVGRDLAIQEDGAVEVSVWVMNQDERAALIEEGFLPIRQAEPDDAVGAVYVDAPASDEETFIGSVDRSLVLAVVGGMVLTLILTIAVSRRILSPIDALTQAVQAMERGDLSQRVNVNAKDEIGKLGGAFNAMADSLARSEELRRNMVTDVAHELRTPLSNIRGYLEAAQDGVVEPDPQFIVSIYEEAMLLNHLVDDLQELALAEAGRLRLVRQSLCIERILQRSVEIFAAQASQKSVKLQLELADNLPEVDADPERVRQVLRNLIINAITHTPAEGQITVAARTVDQHHVEVRISDTGVGIAAEQLENVFERFYRTDRSRSRHTGGAGLGLAIVKQLVEAHGGQVWAESQPGVGATFTFTLPAT